MARTKQHPDIGKFVANYVGMVDDDYRPETFDTAEAALENIRSMSEGGVGYDHDDVIYVYAIVGVKKIIKPTLTENVAA